MLPVPRGSSEEGGETAPEPIVALERDGAIYSVAVLDRLHDTAFSPERFPLASDFHARVVALGGAGLAELDDALKRGERPTEARLLPGAFLWLPPCDPDRALYVQLVPTGGAEGAEPAYRIGNARGLLGHEARVPFPAGEEEPDYELGVAAILGDDLRAATTAEADAAILGFTVIADWTARATERAMIAACLPISRARDFATQLGPVLVTVDEVGDVARLRTRARAGGHVLEGSPAGARRLPIAEAIASVSHSVELRAGDVISAGCVPGGSAAAHGRTVAWDARVELSVERLGTLAGVPVRGPERARR